MTKTLIAIPCMDMMHTQFVASVFRMKMATETAVHFASGSLVYEARNQLAQAAMDGDYDQVLWLDSDMVFNDDMFQKMQAHIDSGIGVEIVSGLYFSRKKPCKPVIYDRCSIESKDGFDQPVIRSFEDYPIDSLFEIKGCGFGGVLMKTDVIRRVNDRYGLPFYPAGGFGEDLAFCYRCQNLGIKLYCDSSIKMRHIAYYEVSEQTFLKGEY